MSADIFISYKSEEEPYARRIRDVLEANGISCWMAPDSIPAGSNYMKQIPQAIEACKAVILLVSEKSQKSIWVKNEFSQAVTENKLIIPYVIQNCPLEDEFRFSMSTMQQVYAWKDENAALERVVRDVRTVLHQNPDAEVKITVVSKKDKTPWVIAAAAVLVLIAALGFVFLRKPAAPKETAAAEVYYSEVIPYVFAGAFATPESAKDVSLSVPEYTSAFSLLSFIRNDSGKPLFAEKIACRIESLARVEEPYIQIDGTLTDDTITVLAYNDGWGDAKSVHAEWEIRREADVPEFSDFEQMFQNPPEFSVPAGGVCRVFQKTYDFTDMLEWSRAQNSSYIVSLYTIAVRMTCEGRESMLAMFLMYDVEKDQMMIEFGGASEDRPSITLFGILDVDNPPQELRFQTGDQTPLIENSYRIETVIGPTKSCELTIQGVYVIGGTEYCTKPSALRVRVPRFEENALMPASPMSRQLAALTSFDDASVKRILDSYRYHPESIFPAAG